MTWKRDLFSHHIRFEQVQLLSVAEHVFTFAALSPSSTNLLNTENP